MARPQEAELRRSGNIPALNPDATESIRQADRAVDPSESRGPVPEDQRPGHRPEHDQDKPDPDKFAAALGIQPDDRDDRPDRADDRPQVGPAWFVPAAVGAVGVGAALCVVRALRRRLADE